MDAKKPYYNVSSDATRTVISKAGRARLSKRMLGNKNTLGWKHTEQSRAKISAANTGRPSPTKGKKRSADVVEKTASAHRGRKRSEETRRRISEAMTGKKRPPRTQVTREKLSKALRGKGQLTEEQVRQIRRMRSSGIKRRDVASKFGIHLTMVSMIMSGARYGWVAET